MKTYNIYRVNNKITIGKSKDLFDSNDFEIFLQVSSQIITYSIGGGNSTARRALGRALFMSSVILICPFKRSLFIERICFINIFI